MPRRWKKNPRLTGNHRPDTPARASLRQLRHHHPRHRHRRRRHRQRHIQRQPSPRQRPAPQTTLGPGQLSRRRALGLWARNPMWASNPRPQRKPLSQQRTPRTTSQLQHRFPRQLQGLTDTQPTPSKTPAPAGTSHRRRAGPQRNPCPRLQAAAPRQPTTRGPAHPPRGRPWPRSRLKRMVPLPRSRRARRRAVPMVVRACISA